MLETETRTAGLLAARAAHVARGVGNAHSIVVARAEGARLWDVDGNEYVDFVGGIGVLNVGHNHPLVVRAVREQLERVTHTCFQVGMYEPYIALAQRLGAIVPGDFPKKAMFVTTGAEATENAVKIARAFTGRPGIVAFANSFHGRTLMGMTLTGKTRPYRQNFGPFAPEVPVLGTALVAGIMLAFALSFDEIVVTTFTAGNQHTLPIWILKQLTRPRDRPVTNVVALFVIALTVVPILLAHRITRDSGGVVGGGK